MYESASTAKSRVIVAGGGVAALEAALALRALAEERVAVELLAPERAFTYRPLAVAEAFAAGRVHRFELAELAAACGAHVYAGALEAVEPDDRLARTSRGEWFEYDALLIACGARPVEAVPGAVTFRGPEDMDAVRAVVDDLRARGGSLVVAVPGGVVWPLPAYELALLAAAQLGPGADLVLVTPEQIPLAVFGGEASDAVAALLEERGIEFRGGSYPVSFEGGRLSLVPGGELEARHVVALPHLKGPALAGVPHDGDGFIPTDVYGRVEALPDVYAAGDVTTFPVKQGGIAAQQAEAAAEAIAAAAGAEVTPVGFRPVLRGLLLTGAVPSFMRAELGGGQGGTATLEHEALWWPPSKIAGRYLGSFLADRAGLELEPPPALAGLAVEVELS